MLGRHPVMAMSSNQPHASALPAPSPGPRLFSVQAKDGKARMGSLTIPPSTGKGTGCHHEPHDNAPSVPVPVQTPASLIYTRRGGTPNLVPDMLRRLDPPPSGFQIDILHLWVLVLAPMGMHFIVSTCSLLLYSIFVYLEEIP